MVCVHVDLFYSFPIERDLHLAYLATVTAGRPRRTRCWVRLCVLKRSYVASHPRASQTKQGQFRSVFDNWPIGLTRPISPKATLGDESRTVAES